MASGSPCFEPPDSKRPRIQTDPDWTKCLKCQTNTNETLSLAKPESIDKFKGACHQRKDSIFRRLEHCLNDLAEKPVVWHKKCYKEYTDARKLAKLPTPILKERNPNFTEQPFLRSSQSPLNLELCIICQKVYHKNDKVLISVATSAVEDTLRTAIDFREDKEFCTRIAGVNLVARKAKYHHGCWKIYTAKKCTSSQKKKLTDIPAINVLSVDEIFKIFISEIEQPLHSGKVFELSDLRDRFREHLTESGLVGSQYKSSSLKQRLIKYFGDQVAFTFPRNQNKSALVFCNSLDRDSALRKAAELQAHLTNQEQVFSKNTANQRTHIPGQSAVLVHAAQIIRQDLKNMSKQYDSSLEDITLDKCRQLVPDSLYNLMFLIVKGEEALPTCEDLNKGPSIAVERRVLSSCQDIMFTWSNGQLRLPKHVGLSTTIFHLSRSRAILNMLNRLGHSLSYDDLQRIDTKIATDNLAKFQDEGVCIPSNITKGNFVQAAADNADIIEETLDGKNTTHATSLVLYQRHNFTDQRETNSSAKSVPSLSKTRLRALPESGPCQVMLEFSAFGKRPDPSFGDGRVDASWFHTYNYTDDTDQVNLIWALCRFVKSTSLRSPTLKPEAQMVPSWTEFNSLVDQSSAPVTAIGYCPFFPSSSVEFSTIYSVMKAVQLISNKLEQENSVITFDQAIYCKAKEIQWRCPIDFDQTVIRLGGFHLVLTFLACIGRRFEESGLEDLLIESGVFGTNTTMNILKGKLYNRAIRAHKLVYEALGRLQWISFCDWLSSSNLSIDDKEITTLIAKCQTAIAVDDKNSLLKTIADLSPYMDRLHNLLSEFRLYGRKLSGTFAFWDDYRTMVELLLSYVKAERLGKWNLHLKTVAGMVPYFFAYDRTNYSRWVPIYLADMRLLEQNAPKVHMEFISGNHPVKRSTKPFNQVWTDMALEQSVNRDSKTEGGIIGISKNEKALNKWFLTFHSRALTVSAMKKMCGIQDDSDVSPNPRKSPSKRDRDESDIQKLLLTIEEQMVNAFDLQMESQSSCSICHLSSGIVATDEISKNLLSCLQTGEKDSAAFVQDRLVSNVVGFYQPIKTRKLKTFSQYRKKVKTKSSTSDKLEIVNGDRTLFGRLLLGAKMREVNLREVLKYELSVVPFSLARTDGSLIPMKKKSQVMPELEKGLSVNALPPTDKPTCWVIDGMAVIQMVRSGNASTFGELSAALLQVVLRPLLSDCNCKRVDVVFDRYDMPLSIKSAERGRRQSSEGMKLVISGGATKIPQQWGKFMDNPQNKSSFTRFLCDSWSRDVKPLLSQDQEFVIGGGFKQNDWAYTITSNAVTATEGLYSSQEEADTRMFLHCAAASSALFSRLIIWSPDTDVAILGIYHFQTLENVTELWFKTGVKDKSRYVPLHQIANSLGQFMCESLPGFHALTGCDSTSKLSKIEKGRAFRYLEKSQQLFQDLKYIGTSVPPETKVFEVGDKFVAALYKNNCCCGVNDLRYKLFCQNQCGSESMPPTYDSLSYHIRRANYQTFIWRNALVPFPVLPEPNCHGWEINTAGSLQPTLTALPPAPATLIEFTKCGCKVSQCRGRCSCSAKNLVCTEACACSGAETCENPFQNRVEEMDSSDESEIDDFDAAEED